MYRSTVLPRKNSAGPCAWAAATGTTVSSAKARPRTDIPRGIADALPLTPVGLIVASGPSRESRGALHYPVTIARTAAIAYDQSITGFVGIGAAARPVGAARSRRSAT